MLTLCVLLSIKIHKRGVAYYENRKVEINNLYELYTIKNNRFEIDSSEVRVLCVGNSITLHGPRKGDLPGADSLWRGNWGMCASRPELDYVHLIEKELRNVNKLSSVCAKNLWEWESNFNVNLDSLLHDYCHEKDLIIVKIGENVRKENEEKFGLAFSILVNYLMKYTPNIIIAGSYWPRPQLDHLMISVAREKNLPFVPLSWIYSSYKKDVIAHVGDTVYDTQLRPYPIATEFICTHPNDRGMEMIAKSILNVISIK